jgi:hypothetical protein
MIRAEAARHIAAQYPAKRGQIEIDRIDNEVFITSAGIWVPAWVLVANADIDELMAEEVPQ